METVKLRLVDVSQWPMLVIKVMAHGSIAEEGDAIMALEERLGAAFGERIELYLDTTVDRNKPRAEVAERVRDWHARRLKMQSTKGAGAVSNAGSTTAPAPRRER